MGLRNNIIIAMGLLSAVMCFSVVAFPAHAEDIAVYHEKTVTETEAEDTWYAVARGTYLALGTGKIKREGYGRVSVSGSTTATQVCDTLKVAIYLDESSDNKSYGTIGTYHFSANNDMLVSGYKENIRVTSGCYYRVRGVHSVTHNNTTETTSSNTDAIIA